MKTVVLYTSLCVIHLFIIWSNLSKKTGKNYLEYHDNILS